MCFTSLKSSKSIRIPGQLEIADNPQFVFLQLLDPTNELGDLGSTRVLLQGLFDPDNFFGDKLEPLRALVNRLLVIIKAIFIVWGRTQEYLVIFIQLVESFSSFFLKLLKLFGQILCHLCLEKLDRISILIIRNTIDDTRSEIGLEKIL